MNLKQEFLVGFPTDNTATTCRMWVSFVVALAGASVYQLKDMKVAEMQEIMLSEYN